MTQHEKIIKTIENKKPKCNIGDRVWAVEDGKAGLYEVFSIAQHSDKEGYFYGLKKSSYPYVFGKSSDEIFLTKGGFIDSLPEEEIR